MTDTPNPSEPRWRRAFSTLGCPELGLDAVLALAAGHGLDAVELRALAGTVELPAFLAGAYGAPDRLAAALREQPVGVVALGTSARLLENRAGDRDALLAFAPWAEAAGVPHLRVFDGGDVADARELDHARALVDWWRGERDARGWAVDIIVETHDALAAPDALARFVQALPEVALLWDSHHTWRKGGQDPAATWAVLRGCTRHVHVKDSVLAPGERLGYRYVLPGFGAFPMRRLRDALAADGYNGVLSLEWERMWHPDLPPLDDALTQAAAAHWW